jgi:hypothetical protein
VNYIKTPEWLTAIYLGTYFFGLSERFFGHWIYAAVFGTAVPLLFLLMTRMRGKAFHYFLMVVLYAISFLLYLLARLLVWLFSFPLDVTVLTLLGASIFFAGFLSILQGKPELEEVVQKGVKKADERAHSKDYQRDRYHKRLIVIFVLIFLMPWVYLMSFVAPFLIGYGIPRNVSLVIFFMIYTFIIECVTRAMANKKFNDK